MRVESMAIHQVMSVVICEQYRLRLQLDNPFATDFFMVLVNLSILYLKNGTCRRKMLVGKSFSITERRLGHK